MRFRNLKKFRKLSLFFSIIFVGSVVVAACSPVNSSTNPKKLLDLGDASKFSSDANYNIPNFAKQVLKDPTIRKSLSKQFVRQLVYNWYQKEIQVDKTKNISLTAGIKENYDRAVKANNDSFNALISATGGINNSSGANIFQRVTLDNNGGNSATYKHIKLLDNLYNQFKSMFGGLATNNFTFLKGAEFSTPSSGGSAQLKYNAKANITTDYKLEKADLDNPANWNKIQFYPHLSEDDQTKPDTYLAYGKNDFDNFVYKKWYDQTKPFNVVMSLWKYDAGASKGQLGSIYNASILNNNFPKKADYKFPYFGSTENQTTNNTPIKFKQFVNNLDTFKPKTDDQTKVFSVPVAYTDDSATSIYVKGNSIFNDLFPPFAAGAVHKFLQLTAGSDVTNKDTITKEVNPISESDLKASGDLIGVFLKDKKENGDVGIEINPQVFNQTSSYKTKSFVMDQRDVTNTPWLLLRNEAGVHAIAIDGYDYIKGDTSSTTRSDTSSKTTSDYLKRAEEFFNFRIVQAANKTALNLENTLASFNPLGDANTYLSDNFDDLILQYYWNNTNNENSIFQGVADPSLAVLSQLQNDGTYIHPQNSSQAVATLKTILQTAIKLNADEPEVDKLFKMSEKLQSQYLSFSLKPQAVTSTADGSSSTKNYSALENGLASVMPYQIGTDFSQPSSITNNGWYNSLATLYTDSKFNNQSNLYNFQIGSTASSSTSGGTSVAGTSVANNGIRGLYQTYNNSIDKLVSELNLKRSDTVEFPAGQQAILTNSDLVNNLLAEFLSNNSNLSNMVTVNAITKNYLSELFDPVTNMAKADDKLGNNFNSLTPTKSGETVKKLPLNQALANEYYAQQFLTSKSPLIYGGFQYYKTPTPPAVAAESSTSSSRATHASVKTNSLSVSSLVAQHASDSTAVTTPTLTPEDNSTIESNYNKKQLANFENQFYYQSVNGYNIYSTNNVAYLDFLKALGYLTRNRFENLRLYLQRSLAGQAEAGFAWTVNVPKTEASKLNDDSSVKSWFEKVNLNYKNTIFNPFASPSVSLNQMDKDVNESFSFTKTSSTYTDENAKADQTFRGFQGLVINNSGNNWNNPTNDTLITDALKNINDHTSTSAKNGVLFHFGSRTNLFNYVNNFSSPSQVDELANNLQRIVSNLDVNAVTANSVTIKNGNSTTIHPLNLYEKRHALMALIYNYKMPTPSSVNQTEFKRIYGTDPANNFVILNQKLSVQTSSANGNYKDNLADTLFQRLTSYLNSSNNNSLTGNKYAFKFDNINDRLAYLIQFNNNDVASSANFLKFARKYLGDQTFMIWLVQLASQKLFQDLANTDFTNSVTKMHVYDTRFRDALSKDYITNKEDK